MDSTIFHDSWIVPQVLGYLLPYISEYNTTRLAYTAHCSMALFELSAQPSAVGPVGLKFACAGSCAAELDFCVALDPSVAPD